MKTHPPRLIKRIDAIWVIHQKLTNSWARLSAMLGRTVFNSLIVLLGLSVVDSGKLIYFIPSTTVAWQLAGLVAGNKGLNNLDLKINVTISVNLPRNGLICVDKDISFTCHAPTKHILIVAKQYQWSINGGHFEISNNNTYTMRVSSRSAIKVCCEVLVKLTNGGALYGSKNIIVHDKRNGKTLNLLYACDHA